MKTNPFAPLAAPARSVSPCPWRPALALCAALLGGCAVFPVSLLHGGREASATDQEAARLAAVQPFVPGGAAQRPAASASAPTMAPGAPPSPGSPPPFADRKSVV